MTTGQPFRIGIIGAENSHATAIFTLINIARTPPGFAVTHLWGESEVLAEKTAKAGRIPTVVSDPAEMLGKIDGLMIDHRDGTYHLAAARPFVAAGIPVFVDKPFSTSFAEACEFLKWRREKQVAVTTMSALTHNACIAGIKDKLNDVRMLAPIAVMEALRGALATGRQVVVPVIG
ncbi:MAG: Gfo/Idh/MocA family oxidoreductase [bacterium]